MSASESSGTRFRHIKRGGVYSIIGNAQVQAPDDAPLTDYELVVVYRDHEGELWVRRKSEFYDGRFERIAATDGDNSKTVLSIEELHAELKSISHAYAEASCAIGRRGDEDISLADQIRAVMEENANLRSALDSCTRSW